MHLSTILFILYCFCILSLFIFTRLYGNDMVITSISFVFLGLGFSTFLTVALQFLMGIFYYQLLRRNSEEIRLEGNHECGAKESLVCVIPAYLPSEKDIILETLEKFFEAIESSRARAQIRVILAYNTPTDIPELELKLSGLETSKPNVFKLVKVEKSTSKAENLNFVLQNHVSDADLVGFFDADHWPDKGAFDRVINRFQAASHYGKQVDCIQGRCIIRNHNDNYLTRFLLAPEFDVIYCFMHLGRYLVSGFGIFGGSNGYWRGGVIKSLCFDCNCLTEDIDCSVRAVWNSYHIVHDPLVVSQELAPTRISDLIRQRKRWARGWFQISIQKPWLQLLSSNLHAASKLGLLHLFIWREFIVHMNLPNILFSLCFLIVDSVNLGEQEFVKYNPPPSINICCLLMLGSMACFSIMTCLSLCLVAGRKFFESLIFSVLLPVYTIFMTVLAVHGSFRVLCNDGQLAWKVTPRSQEKPVK